MLFLIVLAYKTEYGFFHLQVLERITDQFRTRRMFFRVIMHGRFDFTIMNRKDMFCLDEMNV